MAKVIWTAPALQDLNDIAEYIALDKVSAAEKLVTKIFSRVELLEDSPKSGRKPPELEKSSRYREVIVGPCRIFYRLATKEIVVLHVMRGERLLRKYLLDERESTDN